MRPDLSEFALFYRGHIGLVPETDILGYRLHRIARGDATPLPGFDE